MISVQSFETADWAVLGTSGGITFIALLAAVYALPWRRRRPPRQSYNNSSNLGNPAPPQQQPSTNTLWKERTFLALCIAFCAAAQITRLPLLWGPSSIVAPESVTQWTEDGWMCRIYLTAALGVAFPLVAWLTIFLLGAATVVHPGNTARPHPPPTRPPSPTESPEEEEERRKRAAATHVVIPAFMSTLPIAAFQSVIAWIDLGVVYNGSTFEDQPRSVAGYFLAVYWYGTVPECNSGSTDVDATVGSTAATTCTICVFPAASAIVNLAWTAYFLISLWVVGGHLSAAALNRSLARRLWAFIWTVTALITAGCACMGASVVFSPFTWANQALWLGYFASVAAVLLLLVWTVVVRPVRGLRTAAAVARQGERWQVPGTPTHAQEVIYGNGTGAARDASPPRSSRSRRTRTSPPTEVEPSAPTAEAILTPVRSLQYNGSALPP